MPIEESTQKSYFAEYWYVFVLIGIFILFVIAQILRLLTPPVPIKENTWQGVTPGYSTIKQLQEQMGEASRVEELESGQRLYYPPNYESKRFNEIETDESGTVVFIKELVEFDEEHTLADYTEAYGDYDLRLHPSSFAPSVYAHVFLDEGLVIMAHVDRNIVEEKWYFDPVSEEVFLESWGSNLENTGGGPEQLIP